MRKTLNTEKERYTAALIPLAARLVATVRDEGPEAISGILTALHTIPVPAGIQPCAAIAVVLAAMVDPSKSPRELLAWTEQFGGISALEPATQGCNPLAVEMACSGVLPAHSLTVEETVQTVGLLHQRGWPVEHIAEHLDADLPQVRRWKAAANSRLHRQRQAALTSEGVK